jgi:hypothetical protein
MVYTMILTCGAVEGEEHGTDGRPPGQGMGRHIRPGV